MLTLSYSIVLHPKDSMESIFTVLREAALLQKAGCVNLHFLSIEPGVDRFSFRA